MKTINKLISKHNQNAGTTSRIKYIVIHYVGALGGAKANCEYYAGGNRGASAHYYVGFDGEIWQSVEDANIAWHCGAFSYVHPECRNANSIGIEMCVRKRSTKTMNATDKDWYFEDETVLSTIELTRYLMKKYNIPASHVIRHYDVTGKICPNPFVYNTGDYTWDEFKKEISAETLSQPAQEGTYTTEEEFIKVVGPLATADMKKTGVLAAVTVAQAILESGYGTTELAKNAKNFFGMKCILSGNTWPNSSWDGTSKYTKTTKEQTTSGQEYSVVADFRKYPSISASLADHSAYLLGAMSGNKKRYEGLQGEIDYRKAITIIKNGGYATDTKYIDKICNIIERWNLTKYNGEVEIDMAEVQPWYRVRKTWADAKSQLGAYHNLDKAKECVDDNPGYSVFDEAGKAIYTNSKPAIPRTVVEKAVEWAIDIANDNTHGYNNTKGKRGGDPDFACSSYVNEAFKQAGVKLPDSASVYTAKMKSIYTAAGFKEVTSSVNLKTGKGLEIGDIVLSPGKHVELYVGNGQLAGAKGNANSGKPENGKEGDQTGREITVSAYWNYPWTIVLRYVEEDKVWYRVRKTWEDEKSQIGAYILLSKAQECVDKNPGYSVFDETGSKIYPEPVPQGSKPTNPTMYRVQVGAYTVKKNAENMAKKIKDAGYSAIIVNTEGYYKVQTGAFTIKENAEKLQQNLLKDGFKSIIKEY